MTAINANAQTIAFRTMGSLAIPYWHGEASTLPYVLAGPQRSASPGRGQNFERCTDADFRAPTRVDAPVARKVFGPAR
jgi:hypothetical protein